MTGQSDPKTWFDQSNENPTATLGNAMDGTLSSNLCCMFLCLMRLIRFSGPTVLPERI